MEGGSPQAWKNSKESSEKGVGLTRVWTPWLAPEAPLRTTKHFSASQSRSELLAALVQSGLGQL